MSDVRFKLSLRGLNELMRSGEMQAILNRAALQIAEELGVKESGVEFAHPIRFVAIAAVRGSNKNNGLEKAAGGVNV